MQSPNAVATRTKFVVGLRPCKVLSLDKWVTWVEHNESDSLKLPDTEFRYTAWIRIATIRRMKFPFGVVFF